MEEWQKRVIEEQKDLSGKITKLSNYIGANASRTGTSVGGLMILSRQLKVMCEYNEILKERIEGFNEE
jgi:hypothetical protein